MSDSPATRAVRPGFGPTLPALLQGRFGIPPRRTTAAVIAFAVLVLAVVLVVQKLREPTQLVHRGSPTFNLAYHSPVHSVAPRAGELARLTARTPRASWTLTVRALPLPAYRGDLGHALLPVLAERQVSKLASANPGFGVTDEGRAQINGLPGYQIGFVAENRRLHGRDVMLLPADRGARLGVVLSFRQLDPTRKFRQREKDVSKEVKKALRSFGFGTSRP